MRLKQLCFAAVCAALTLTAVCSNAQFARGPRYAVVSASVAPGSLAPGGHGQLIVQVVLTPQFHINSAHPKDPDLIATVFQPSSSKSISWGTPKYPKDEMVKTATGTEVAYTGTADIIVPFTVKSGAKAGSAQVGGKLTYQGCNATACYPPKTDSVSAAVRVK